MRPTRTALLVLTAAALVGVAAITPAYASAANGSVAPAVVTPAAVAPNGQYTSLTAPVRFMDTRSNFGASGPVGAGRTVNLQISGRGGLPSTGVSSVVFNLTVTQPTVGGFVTVYPTGHARPSASNINFRKNWTGANLVTVKLGTSGQVSLYNNTGSTELIADVVGWYSDGTASPATTGVFYRVQPPTRLVDTRNTGRLPAQATLTDPMTFKNGAVTADSHVKAVAVSLTAVHPTNSGYLAAWSGSGAVPKASVLNFTAGKVVPNLTVIPTRPCPSTICTGASVGLPSIAVKNGSNGSVDLLIDIWGFYDDGTNSLTGGLTYKPLAAPVRIMDTRAKSRVGNLSTFGSKNTKTVTNTSAVADANTAMLVQNVTSVPTENTYLTLWRAGDSKPAVSNLNPIAGSTVAGLAVTAVGSTNNFSVYNSSGSDDVIIDVSGSFEAPGGAIAQAERAAAHPIAVSSRPVLISP